MAEGKSQLSLSSCSAKLAGPVQSPRAPPTLQARSGVTLCHPGVLLRTQRWSPWHSLNTDKERGRKQGSTPTSSAGGEDYDSSCLEARAYSQTMSANPIITSDFTDGAQAD